MSCKNQSRISVRVSDDSSSLTRVSDDTSSLARVSDDISGPIRLRHVSPIGLCHVLLTHLQTPINRSLPKTFRRAKIQKGQDSEGPRFRGPRFRSEKALLESSPETSSNFKNFDLKCKEHSKQNHLNYLPRSQRSLEPSSKASKNLNKPPKPQRTSTTNLQIQRKFEEESSKSYS